MERGGRAHFPDKMRRLLNTGIIGCVFIEKEEYLGPKMLFEGFHSSGRQSVDIPIVRLSKFHADQFLSQKPSHISFQFRSGVACLDKLVQDDIPFSIATASRLGEASVLLALLQGTCGTYSMKVWRENLFKSI